MPEEEGRETAEEVVEERREPEKLSTEEETYDMKRLIQALEKIEQHQAKMLEKEAEKETQELHEHEQPEEHRNGRGEATLESEQIPDAIEQAERAASVKATEAGKNTRKALAGRRRKRRG